MYYDSREGQKKWWLLVETNNIFNLFQMIRCWFSIPEQIKFPYTLYAIRKVIYKMSG